MRLLGIVLLLTACCATRAQSVAEFDLDVLEQQALFEAAARVAPSVVRIETLGGTEKVGDALVSMAATSGVVVSEDGYIVSSAYSFAQDPTSILVTLPSGKRTAAVIVSRDYSRMLVLLKVETQEPLIVPVAADLSAVRVGQWAVAVGRAADSDDFQMTVGIVSAKNRIWGRALQTDANVSPSNYGGALVDIHGRALGVLVPLSPDSESVAAGAEWYDSGIGFAAPFAEVLASLPRLQLGDLRPGKLGISLQGNDIYGAKAVIAVSRPNSPAREAGLEAEDVIVAVDGAAIATQAELKHALGPRLAGDQVQLQIQRGEEQFSRDVQLVGELEPYEHAFLGVLPRRDPTTDDDQDAGFAVRYVYPESPAAQSGLQVGDRLLRADDIVIDGPAGLRQTLAAFEPDDSLTLVFERAGVEGEVAVKLARLPADAPQQLPPGFPSIEQENDNLPQLGKINVKLPEEAGECLAYIPTAYDPRFSHSLLVLLPVPGQEKASELLERWRVECDATRTILLLPQAKEARSWLPTEAAFVRKTIENLRTEYNVDDERIAVMGSGVSGAMSYLVAFAHRDLIRGVAAVEAPVPGRAPPIFNEPLQRLAFYVAVGPDSRLADRVESDVAQLEAAKFPVTRRDLGDNSALDDDGRGEVLRWLDALDRI